MLKDAFLLKYKANCFDSKRVLIDLILAVKGSCVGFGF